MNNLESSAKLLKILGKGPGIGNARNAKNQIILVEPVERSEVGIANGEHRLGRSESNLREIKLLILEQVHVLLNHAQVDGFHIVGALRDDHHVALENAIGWFTQSA